MVGLLQIMIYLMCIYLVYKGVEIFQIAFVSSSEKWSRKVGMLIGAAMIAGAIVAGVGAVVATEMMAKNMNDRMNSIPSLR